MVTWRLTRKLQKLLNINPTESLQPTTSKLGDWYANLVPTYAGDLIVFVNEKTLLSVAVPISESRNIFFWFPTRVGNLLGLIGIPLQTISHELQHYTNVQFGKTNSRSILGSMNDIAYNYQFIAENKRGKGNLSLSDAEYQLSKMPFKSLGYKFPEEVVKEMMI